MLGHIGKFYIALITKYYISLYIFQQRIIYQSLLKINAFSPTKKVEDYMSLTETFQKECQYVDLLRTKQQNEEYANV